MPKREYYIPEVIKSISFSDSWTRNVIIRDLANFNIRAAPGPAAGSGLRRMEEAGSPGGLHAWRPTGLSELLRTRNNLQIKVTQQTDVAVKNLWPSSHVVVGLFYGQESVPSSPLNIVLNMCTTQNLVWKEFLTLRVYENQLKMVNTWMQKAKAARAQL